ncbi:MAG: DUF5362 domain-containing protein [Melioribacter sp.]|nr:DUF5362 domain-containing protein [Melioribacter sp.]
MDQQDNINIEDDSSNEVKISAFKITFEKMIKDMRFVGIFTVVYGALYCLSIVGAIIGIPIIIIGLRIREAADQFEIFKTTNNAASLRMGFELQGKYFRIMKILIIIGIILTLIWITLIIIILASGLSTLMQMREFEYNTI